MTDRVYRPGQQVYLLEFTQSSRLCPHCSLPARKGVGRWRAYGRQQIYNVRITTQLKKYGDRVVEYSFVGDWDRFYDAAVVFADKDLAKREGDKRNKKLGVGYDR